MYNKMSCCSGPAENPHPAAAGHVWAMCARRLLWVKTRKAQNEQMRSGLPHKAGL